MTSKIWRSCEKSVSMSCTCPCRIQHTCVPCSWICLYNSTILQFVHILRIVGHDQKYVGAGEFYSPFGTLRIIFATHKHSSMYGKHCNKSHFCIKMYILHTMLREIYNFMPRVNGPLCLSYIIVFTVNMLTTKSSDCKGCTNNTTVNEKFRVQM